MKTINGSPSFESAAEVKAFLKEKGITYATRVQFTRNPFGGEGKFAVRLAEVPTDICLVTSSGPEGTRFASTPNGSEIVQKLSALRDALKQTNAFAVA